MLTMKIETLVNALVQSELSKNQEKNKALYFGFDLHLSVSTPSVFKRRGLNLLYYKEGAFTSVFSAVTNLQWSVPEKTEWKHEVSHDSCWRDIRVFSETYFKMAEEINKYLRDFGYEEVAPCNMNQLNTPRMFGSLYEWKKVKVIKDSTDQNNYRRLVELI